MGMIILLLLSVACFGSTSAMADGDTVKHWLPLCKPLVSKAQLDLLSAYNAGKCQGMIEASASIIQAARPGGLPFRACLPDNTVTTTQLVTTVLQWIEQKPDLENASFLVAAQIAVAASWPCQQQP